MANGKVMFPSGGPAPITYIFPQNFDFGHKPGYLDTDDNVRAIDGTLNSYAGPQKKAFDLHFSFAPKNQFDYFKYLWTLQVSMDLYMDGVNLDAIVKIMQSPSGQSEAAFDDSGDEVYSFDVRFEEV